MLDSSIPRSPCILTELGLKEILYSHHHTICVYVYTFSRESRCFKFYNLVTVGRKIMSPFRFDKNLHLNPVITFPSLLESMFILASPKKLHTLLFSKPMHVLYSINIKNFLSICLSEHIFLIRLFTLLVAASICLSDLGFVSLCWKLVWE